jgi:hypothetical protein
LQIRFADPGHVGDQDEVVALAKDIERRIAAAARTGAEPVARSRIVEQALELHQCVERVCQ